MITPALLDAFLHDVHGQALREGTRYARQGRVGDLVGSAGSVATVVRGRTDDFEVALWAEDGVLAHRCTCPSWRDPCKHEVAAAMAMLRRHIESGGDAGHGRTTARQAGGARAALARGRRRAPAAARGPRVVRALAPAREPTAEQAPAAARGHRPSRDRSSARAGSSPGALPVIDPEAARRAALEERRAAGRRDKLVVRAGGDPPFVTVTSPSGFAYRVQLRGGPGGPHSCDCPDFEANRLHTCKHVERVRRYLAAPRTRLPRAHRRAAQHSRIYLHFGEVVEPRLHGVPAGRGAPAVRQAFDEAGMPLRPLSRGESELRDWLGGFGEWVEPQALDWLDRRIARRPILEGMIGTPEGRGANGSAVSDSRARRAATRGRRRLAAAPSGNGHPAAAALRRLLPALGGKPYPYQWEGAAFLARSGRALLADEMGLGKTVQAILAATALRRARRPARHVTIVCPASLRGGWRDEIRRWVGEEDVVLLEGPAPERARTIASRPRWLITHYEQVLRDHPRHRTHPPDLLILDEAQRAKGLWTRTARVLKSIDAPYVFALTGTPLENRLEEAYAIAQLIDQRLLPPLWQIERDHFVREEGRRRVVLYRNLDALRSRLAPAFLRRRKEDVALQLPDRIRSIGMVAMHPDVMPTYEDVMTQVKRIASKKVLLPHDLERMQRLLVIARRCCNGPHMLGQEVDDRKVPKLQELEQALRDLCLGEGRKAVVFSEWTDMTERVESLCGRLELAAFHLRGSVPVRRRPALLRAFCEHDGPAVFISTDAGGLGLNLQAADVVINLDLPWNPARLEQRIARVHRIGSRHTVQILLVVARESLEERILELHDTKRNVLDNIWAKDGEDIIAAPGGSGAFREMVRSLLEKEPVARPHGEVAPVEMPHGETAHVETAARDGEALGDGATLSPDAKEQREVGAVESAAAQRSSRMAAGSAGSPRPAATDPASVAVDPAALASAVAAVVPSIPPEHRRSLATVFRSLAEVLEGQDEAPASRASSPPKPSAARDPLDPVLSG